MDVHWLSMFTAYGCSLIMDVFYFGDEADFGGGDGCAYDWQFDCGGDCGYYCDHGG